MCSFWFGHARAFNLMGQLLPSCEEAHSNIQLWDFELKVQVTSKLWERSFCENGPSNEKASLCFLCSTFCWFYIVLFNSSSFLLEREIIWVNWILLIKKRNQWNWKKNSEHFRNLCGFVFRRQRWANILKAVETVRKHRDESCWECYQDDPMI